MTTIGLPTAATMGTNHEPSPHELNQILEAVRRQSNVVIVPMRGTVAIAPTSATYVDITGWATTSTKVGSRSESDWGMLLVASCFTGTAGARVTFGISINGTDIDVASKTYTATGQHSAMGGIIRVSNVDQGPNIYKARIKCSAGSVTMNSGDFAMMVLFELPNA